MRLLRKQTVASLSEVMGLGMLSKAPSSISGSCLLVEHLYDSESFVSRNRCTGG